MPSTPPDFSDLIATVRKLTDRLVAMAKQMQFAWDPNLHDPKKLHNMYARNLVSSYVSKFSGLSSGLLDAIAQSNFLVYALCGRALIENTAMLRYYIVHKYKPLFDKGSLSPDDMESLIQVDDQHLRGGRFDWKSFLYERYSRLETDALAHLKSNKQKKSKKSEDKGAPHQINAITCVEKWAEEKPAVLIAYHLFCDLVHPNIGSTFLIASTHNDNLYFSRFCGESVGRQIMEQSFPILVATSHKPFGDYLTLLIGTIWHDDEL